jgi:hypothetical protein
MSKFTNEKLKEFINEVKNAALLNPAMLLPKVNFTELYYTFIDKNNIIPDSEDDNEISLYHNPAINPFIGAIALHKIYGNEDILKYFISLKENAGACIFKLKHHIKEEDNLSFIEIYKKWSPPPSGWIASFCKCGELSPITPDITTLKNAEFIVPPDLEPVKIDLNKASLLEIYSDNSLRISVDEKIYICNIYEEIKFKQLMEVSY